LEKMFHKKKMTILRPRKGKNKIDVIIPNL
jgi:hypothetical protein